MKRQAIKNSEGVMPKAKAAEPTPGPFDPSDPFDAAADMFRRQVAELAIVGLDAKPYRDLDPIKKLEAFMGGVLTGLIGVCFAHVHPEAYGQIMESIEAYLPQARVNAEGCAANAPPSPSETK